VWQLTAEMQVMWLASASYCCVIIQDFTINRILHFQITHKTKLLDSEEIKTLENV
jgi:hypothetical protein